MRRCKTGWMRCGRRSRASTILKKSGNVRVIGYPYQENMPNVDVTAMFAKESWLKAKADAAKRFCTVFTRAQKFMTEAPKADRDTFVSKFTSVRPERC